MPLVPREKIDDVRDRTNIVDVIKRYVELKRAGTGSWKGLCPFHAEKTPSFHVHEPRQFFHCFGCGEKGDVFGFLVKIDQRSFTEVLRDLAQQAGVELPEREPLSSAERRARADAESERDRLLRVMDMAAGFFEQSYAGAAGEAARAYVNGRGIGADVRARFRVGYAPARWDALQDFLAGSRVDPSDAERLGLVGTGERGRYDFFRDRVMLPVFDRQKRVIGFGSRLLDPNAKDRKYVNSPDSPLFHKKECLYGLHTALDAIRKTGTAIVVEGNFDVMALHEAGVEEAVAPMGTALTTEQASTLSRIARRVVVIFDGDGAGKRAAEKAVPLFVEADLDGRIARLPAGEDPDDFVRKNGAAAFRQLVEGARPMLDQFIQDAAQETTVPGRVAAMETVAALLVKVRNATTRELYARQLTVVLGLTPQQVGRALRAAQEQGEREADRRRGLRGDGQAAGGQSTDGPGGTSSSPPPVVERALPRDELELLALVVTYPELSGTPEAKRAGDLLVDPGARQMFRAAQHMIAASGRLDFPTWLEAGPADVRRSIAAALMDDGVSRAGNPATSLRALSARLELQRVEAEISMTTKMLEQAQSRGDVEGRVAAMKRHSDLQRTRLGLKQALERP
ncbi:MAG: DNA primase [Pseudomonadota bacterium]